MSWRDLSYYIAIVSVGVQMIQLPGHPFQSLSEKLKNLNFWRRPEQHRVTRLVELF